MNINLEVTQFTVNCRKYFDKSIELKDLYPKAIYINEFLNHYLELTQINQGGNGIIVETMNKTSNKVRVLKIIKNEFYPLNVVAVLNTLTELEQTPHLTYIFNVHILTVQNRLIHLIGNGTIQSNFRCKPEPATVLEMDKFDGNLETIKDSLEFLIFKIQRAFTLALLKQFGVIMSDLKLRNILYRKITNEDFWQKKQMNQFTHWKYSYDHIELYLPCTDKIIALTDYDEWEISTHRKMNSIRKYLSKIDDIGNLCIKFAKPSNPEAKILEVMHLSTSD